MNEKRPTRRLPINLSINEKGCRFKVRAYKQALCIIIEENLQKGL